MYGSVCRSLIAAALLLSAQALLAGCQENNGLIVEKHEIISRPEGTVSVYQLAGRLKMVVVRSNSACASLRNGDVTVLVFADPEGQAFVNGQPAGPVGGIVPVGDTLFLPGEGVEPIRAAVRAEIRAAQARRSRITRRNRVPDKPAKLVVLDPGHGGRDPGAPGCNGIMEKDINLSVSRMAAEILRTRGLRVIMTRSDDTFVELNERAAIANRKRADLFVSIHSDAAENPRAQGFTVFVSRSASGSSIRAADALARHMAAAAPHSRGIRRADFRVLVRTTCPAVLVELGFLSNRQEAARLARPAYQRRLAEAVADGVMDFLE